MIIKEMYSFLELSNLKYNRSNVEKYLGEFDYVFSHSPIKEHESGFGYNEAVYLSLELINLKIISKSIKVISSITKIISIFFKYNFM